MSDALAAQKLLLGVDDHLLTLAELVDQDGGAVRGSTHNDQLGEQREERVALALSLRPSGRSAAAARCDVRARSTVAVRASAPVESFLRCLFVSKGEL